MARGSPDEADLSGPSPELLPFDAATPSSCSFEISPALFLFSYDFYTAGGHHLTPGDQVRCFYVLFLHGVPTSDAVSMQRFELYDLSGIRAVSLEKRYAGAIRYDLDLNRLMSQTAHQIPYVVQCQLPVRILRRGHGEENPMRFCSGLHRENGEDCPKRNSKDHGMSSQTILLNAQWRVLYRVRSVERRSFCQA